eukprot:Pgem_evm1s16237
MNLTTQYAPEIVARNYWKHLSDYDLNAVQYSNLLQTHFRVHGFNYAICTRDYRTKLLETPFRLRLTRCAIFTGDLSQELTRNPLP